MELGICVASHIGDTDYVVRAEELGYSHAWLADSQMLWSDCYATLALAAHRTSHIKLGTGVAVSGTRPAPVNAASIATINALAPGRTFFGIGSGNTARRVMGLPPQRIKQFEQYLQIIAPLLKGEEAEMPDGDDTIPIRHIMQDKGFVNFDDPIPLYISGFGPRSLALAGKYGDGAVLGLTGNPAALASVWHMIAEGGREVGREVGPHGDYYSTALTTMVVLDEGEAVDSERVKSECGAMAMAAVHYSYDQYRNFGHQPPNALAGIWEDYTGLLETYPAERRHQRIHAGHNCWVLPEEEKFLTPDVLNASSMIGTKSDLIERVRALGAGGLNQIMILPNFDTRFDVLERVAADILPNV
jgi:alkanesulfonate monooxygenase SsuD/methylene tetrahydromethanopterin reductase-like flavin-dependent oxidoreductase (luciferase family)